jgi:hypothetical protein
MAAVGPIAAVAVAVADYAQNRASFRSGEIRILDSSGNVERTIPFNNESNRKFRRAEFRSSTFIQKSFFACRAFQSVL